MELLQGQGGALSNLLSTTGAFTQNSPPETNSSVT